MPKPSQNGAFSVRKGRTDFKRGESVYKFDIISDDNRQAEFAIYRDIATMIRAIDNVEAYLKPVCRSNAILHISATKIITIEKGLAILEDHEWRVVKKAVIKYA